MTDLTKFLTDAWKKAGTKRGAALAIGIAEGYFKNALAGRHSIGEEAARRLAAYIEIDVNTVMRAKIEAEPKYRRLATAAAFLAAVGISAFSSPQDANASENSALPSQDAPTHCVLCKIAYTKKPAV